MTNARLMDVLNTADQFEVKLASLLLTQSGVSYNEIKELTPITVFHDHIELLLGFNDFIKLDNVWMPYLFQYFDFSSNSFDIFLIVNFIFLEYFDCNL